MNKLLTAVATILIILGVLIAIVGWFIFPVCGGTMRCGYTARAETVVGSLIVLVGALLMFTKTSETRILGGAVGIGMGVVTVLLPTYIIGMCTKDTMPCRIGTEPALIILGAIAIIVSVILIAKNLPAKLDKQ